MASSLSFLDKSFWLAESEASPKHVGCIQLLEMPKHAEPSVYVHQLFEQVKSFNKPSPPFNCRVRRLLGYPLGLQPVKSLDMNYHVQYLQIDDVTDRKAIDAKIAALHASRLETENPLWQYFFLHDGVSRQFVIYARVHHLYGDGATLVRWFQAGYKNTPCDDTFVPLWAIKRLRHPRHRHLRWRDRLGAIWQGIKTTLDFSLILLRLLLRSLRINPHYMPVPFTGTKTRLTGQLKPGRAVTTLDLDFTRVRALAKRTRASANEVLLCAFDIAVHRFLQAQGHVFEKALYTNMPINLRKPGEKVSGNRIAIVPVELAHGEQDPYLRLRQIITHHRIVKHAAQNATPGAFSAYTIAIQAISLVCEWLHLSDWIKPIANVLVSNIPGPPEHRYLKDAKLLSCYPVSTLTPGGGVNITLMTYAGSANIGMVCCNRHVSSLAPLADYFTEAFDLLEKSVDNPYLSMDDIGEHSDAVVRSIVSDE